MHHGNQKFTETMEYKMNTNNISNNRFVREHERKELTALSRTQAWRLEKLGLFPQRVQLSSRCVAWKLNELLDWINNQPRVENK